VRKDVNLEVSSKAQVNCISIGAPNSTHFTEQLYRKVGFRGSGRIAPEKLRVEGSGNVGENGARAEISQASLILTRRLFKQKKNSFCAIGQSSAQSVAIYHFIPFGQFCN
jgi:hypothetical protein